MRPDMYEAAKLGDFDSLRAIISGNGEDLFHQTTPKENSILHVAAQYKQVEFIEHILQYPSGPALLWQGNYTGDTPLHLAAKVGSCEAVRVFIDLAESLRWVVESGQVDACKELLRKQNSHEDTALHYALRGGHHGVVESLIEEDPQLCNITNAADESPLYVAAERGLFHTVDLILGALSVSSPHKGPKGLTAAHATLLRPPTGWWKIMEKIPEMIREGDDVGRTPLHYLAFYGKVETVRLLLQRDTSATYDLDNEGQSALHMAAFGGHVNVIEELLRSCPDACDIISTNGQTALHAAVIGERINVVKYLLRMPNLEDLINEQDTDGNTALHLAALHKQYNIIYIMARDKRVDRRATNKDHLTALDIFYAHKEVGYKAAKVKHLLRQSRGATALQDYLTERLDTQLVEGQPAVSTTTGSNPANRENFDSSKKSITDNLLIVAVLVATVTFAATFTMPGGYKNDGPDQGMATLAGRLGFQLFVAFNAGAFGFSVLAIFLQLYTSLDGVYTTIIASCISIAILWLVLAFTCGTYVVLTKTSGLGITPYVVAGCLVIVLCIAGTPDPFGRYVRNLLFDYGILYESC